MSWQLWRKSWGQGGLQQCLLPSLLPQWWMPSQSVAGYCLEYVLKLAVSEPSAVSLSLQCWQRKILSGCKQFTKLITEKREWGGVRKRGSGLVPVPLLWVLPTCAFLPARERQAVDQENLSQIGDAGSNVGICLSWNTFYSPFRINLLVSTGMIDLSLPGSLWMRLHLGSFDGFCMSMTSHLGVPQEFRAVLRSLVG